MKKADYYESHFPFNLFPTYHIFVRHDLNQCFSNRGPSGPSGMNCNFSRVHRVLMVNLGWMEFREVRVPFWGWIRSEGIGAKYLCYKWEYILQDGHTHHNPESSIVVCWVKYMKYKAGIDHYSGFCLSMDERRVALVAIMFSRGVWPTKGWRTLMWIILCFTSIESR